MRRFIGGKIAHFVRKIDRNPLLLVEKTLIFLSKYLRNAWFFGGKIEHLSLIPMAFRTSFRKCVIPKLMVFSADSYTRARLLIVHEPKKGTFCTPFFGLQSRGYTVWKWSNFGRDHIIYILNYIYKLYICKVANRTPRSNMRPYIIIKY